MTAPAYPMPLNQNYEPLESWSCEDGCEWACALLSIETSPMFLKLKYRCPTCSAQMTRYYDLHRRGYVDAAGVRLEGTPNERVWVDRQPCTNKMTCPIKAVTRHIKKGLEVEDFIDTVASAAAIHCPAMNDRQLPRCFVK